MASKGAKAQLTDTSLKRLRAAIEIIAGTTGVSAVVIPDYDRDPEMLIGLQLEAMAHWAETLAERFGPAELQMVDAETGEPITGFIVTEQTASSLSFLAETLVEDAGLDWETVDFTDQAEIDPLTHIEQQMLKALRAKGLLPDQPGEVVMTYTDEGGNPTDADGNPLLTDPIAETAAAPIPFNLEKRADADNFLVPETPIPLSITATGSGNAALDEDRDTEDADDSAHASTASKKTSKKKGS